MGGIPQIYVRPIPDYPDDKWRSTYWAHTHRTTPSREPGVDYYCPIGTTLHSLGDGVVTEIGGGVVPATGRYVRVRLDSGQGFRLLHLGPRHSLKRVGDRVRLGEPLAISGASGYGSEYFGAASPYDAQMILNTGGPHTHLTLFPRWNATYAEAIDPEPWMMSPAFAGLEDEDMPLNDDDKSWIRACIREERDSENGRLANIHARVDQTFTEANIAAVRIRGFDPNADMLQLILSEVRGAEAPALTAADLARELAPLIDVSAPEMTDAELERITKSLADEQARRLAE